MGDGETEKESTGHREWRQEAAAAKGFAKEDGFSVLYYVSRAIWRGSPGFTLITRGALIPRLAAQASDAVGLSCNSVALSHLRTPPNIALVHIVLNT